MQQEDFAKLGISASDAKKAMKMLENKKFAAHVARMAAAGNMIDDTSEFKHLSAREKLRRKLRKAKESRQKSVATTTKEATNQESSLPKKETTAAVSSKNKKKYRQKKMKKLQDQYGTVSNELYTECLQRVQLNNYSSPDDKNRDNNIIALYSKQQQFSNKINMDDLDDLLS